MTEPSPVPEARPRSFACPTCGAGVVWDPAGGVQRCPNCRATIAPPVSGADGDSVRELDFAAWSRSAAAESLGEERLVARCASCGGESTFGGNVTAASCAFCGAAMSAQRLSRKLIKPAALLPFRITPDDAFARFAAWVRSRRLAPNTFAKLAVPERQKLRGVYLPFWTYDAIATTSYTGARGDDFQEVETYTAQEDGRSVTRTRTVTRTRWSSARGTVTDDFDDVLVVASASVPTPLVRSLEPWDLDHLVPYADEYLAGFEAESYGVDLGGGFTAAQAIMSDTIRESICADIGGDHQRVDSVDTSYRDVTFKHLLLPMWLCVYRFRDRIFRFVVNARTGEVQGERPWSWVKIGLIVLLVAAAVVAIFVLRDA